MSAGKAIVASKNGGMAEMIDEEKGGVLISPLNSKAIARAILALADNPTKKKRNGGI